MTLEDWIFLVNDGKAMRFGKRLSLVFFWFFHELVYFLREGSRNIVVGAIVWPRWLLGCKSKGRGFWSKELLGAPKWWVTKLSTMGICTHKSLPAELSSSKGRLSRQDKSWPQRLHIVLLGDMLETKQARCAIAIYKPLTNYSCCSATTKGHFLVSFL